MIGKRRTRAYRESVDNMIWVICNEHQRRNNDIHRKALNLLSIGISLRDVVEFCRYSYREADESFRRTNYSLHNLQETV